MTTDKYKKIFITGASGLLGSNWAFNLRDKFDVNMILHKKEVYIPGTKSKKLDLSSKSSLIRYLDGDSPSLMIHAAGLTSIEECEKFPEKADEINVEITATICDVCKTLGITLIHISTDNLFDGESSLVTESHHINPVNVYGKSKSEAEQRIIEQYEDVLIVRTNFYGWGPAHKPSFSDSIINSLRCGKIISLFSDVYYTPIYIPMLIKSTHEILNKGGRGIFHVVGDEMLSKYDFGNRLADKFSLDKSLIREGKLQEMHGLVKRPLNMSLSNQKARNLIGRSLGDIDEQLTQLKQDESSVLVHWNSDR